MSGRPPNPHAEAAATGCYIDLSTNPLRLDKEDSRQQPRAPPPRLAYAIHEFCAALGISQAYYYMLKKAGRGPREMALGARRIISVEEAIRWCAEQTAASNQQPMKSDQQIGETAWTEAGNEQLDLRDLHLATLRDADRNRRIQEVLTITTALGLTIRDLEIATSLKTDAQGPATTPTVASGDDGLNIS